eukprot:Skav215019  [mRNA]  locus=scaffold966:118336:119053:- [translate_table: standard]
MSLKPARAPDVQVVSEFQSIEDPTNFIKKWWRKVCKSNRAINIHLKSAEKQLLGPMHPSMVLMSGSSTGKASKVLVGGIHLDPNEGSHGSSSKDRV